MKILNSWRPNESLEEAIARLCSHVYLDYVANVPALLLVTTCDTELDRDPGSRTNSNDNY